jgi:GTP:adenosylcobinamide-phosphate guanylyltransferase
MTVDTKVDALVLGGGDGAVIDSAAPFKGVVPVAGKPMVEWVVDALRGSSLVNEISVVVPTAENLGSWADKVDKLVISDSSFIGNAVAGLSALNSGLHVLGATGDLPALTPDAIDDFVTRSLESGAGITYPLVRKEDVLEQFPGSERTFVTVDHTQVTGGNCMLFTPGVVERNQEIGQRLFDTRKSVAAMARVVGFRFVVRLATRRVRAVDVEAKMEELLGVPCSAIYTKYASIGADVDKPVDVIVAERILFERSQL